MLVCSGHKRLQRLQSGKQIQKRRRLQPFQDNAWKEVVWLVKLRVSYERPEELQEVVSRLGAGVKCVKVPKGQGAGRFRRAYIDLGALPGKTAPCTQGARGV